MPDLTTTEKATKLSEDLPREPKHGLTTIDGDQNIAGFNSLPPKQKELLRPSSGELKACQTPLKSDNEGKKRLGEAVVIFNDTLSYPKQPEQLENVVKVYFFALSDYPVKKIIDAMAFYMRNNKGFPDPSDIVHIIERGNKPRFDQSVYISVCKKEPSERTADEWEYKKDYEQYMITGIMK